METILLGGYTRRKNKGLMRVQLDTTTQKLSEVSLVCELDSPTYATVVGPFVFSVVKDAHWGGVTLLESTQTGYQSVASALIENVNPPCYVSYDRARGLVYSAYYHQGFFSVSKVTETGMSVVETVQFEGRSVHQNQEAPHVHFVEMDRQNRYLFVCDLGTDMVHTFSILDDGQAKGVATYICPEGFGPRHLVQHPTQPYVYVLGELSNQISVCYYNEKTGELNEITCVSLLPDGEVVSSSGAAIRISQDGKYVYASNRGHNSLVVYAVQADGTLEAIQWIASGGKTPRDFNFNQTQDYVIVGHQDSDDLVLFAREQESGKLTKVDQTYAPECVCVIPIV